MEREVPQQVKQVQHFRGRTLPAAALVGVLTILLLSTAACTAGQSSLSRGEGFIQAKGSDTMVNLAQMWAESYMQSNPEVVVAVTGGGSGTGISAMINGTASIANTSRAMKQKEQEQAAAQGIDVVENIVALDGIAVVVHPDNPVEELTLDQLAGIFAGEITDWGDVGGTPGPIVILSRESNSGTHVFFKEHVLNRGDSKGGVEYAPEALLLPSSQAIFEEVSQNPNAIGYVGMGYVLSGVRALKVSRGEGLPGGSPSIETVQDDSYPISRPLYIYTRTDSSQDVLDYLDWIRGPEGQEIVRELDFVPLKQEDTT